MIFGTEGQQIPRHRSRTKSKVRTLALAMLLIVLASSPSQSAGKSTAPAEEAVDVARMWLESLRAGEVSGLIHLSGYPFRIEGLNIDSGPDAITCGNKPRPDGLEGVRYFDPRGPQTPTVTFKPCGGKIRT